MRRPSRASGPHARTPLDCVACTTPRDRDRLLDWSRGFGWPLRRSGVEPMIRIVSLLLLLTLLASACDQSGRTEPVARSGPEAPPPEAAAPVTSPPAEASDPIPPEATTWLRQNAIPFTTSKPESGFADLQ